MIWRVTFLMLCFYRQVTANDCTDINAAICRSIKPFCDNPVYREYAIRSCPVTCRACPSDLDPNGLCSKDKECQQRCSVIDKTKKVCSCYSGYRLESGSGQCVDVNECNSGLPLCLPGEICFNVPGGHLCEKVDCGRGKSIMPYMFRAECCKLEPRNAACGIVPALPTQRIVGGYTPFHGQWPWQVLIYTDRNVICGGSLLNNRWVLTAAHCFSQYNENTEVLLYTGVYQLGNLTQSPIQRRGMKRFITYPGWDSTNFHINDVALVELDKTVKFDNYTRPICLPNGEKPSVGTKCFASGWGKLNEKDVAPSAVLQFVDLPIVEGSKCEGNYANNRLKVNQTIMTCAGYDEGGKDACSGDSGGPLMCQRCESCGWYVAGIVSFGSGCARKGKYGVFADVLYHEDWIASQIGMTLTKSKNCLGPQYLEWSAWSACRNSNDKTGKRTRRRECRQNGVPSTGCIGKAVDVSTRSCLDFDQWSRWSGCDATCGSGERSRVRKCILGELGDKGCPSDQATETQPCNTNKCPSWFNWENWTTCSQSCGGGEQTRTRTCSSEKTQCKGTREQTRKCNTNQCIHWSAWSPSGPCSKTCGSGVQTQTRRCIGGNNCEGSSRREVDCNSQQCPLFGKWSKWERCDVSCGGGSQIRTRQCENGKLGDDGCRKGGEEQRQTCNTQDCPAFDQWSEWSECSVSCGGGSQQSTRKCTNGKVGNDGCIGQTAKTRSCSTNECKGEFGTWTNWSPCSRTCGDGRKKRVRECLGGTRCEGEAEEQTDCKEKECPVFGEWSKWTDCPVSCGGGQISRSRNCLHTSNPQECRGDFQESKDCNTEVCPGRWSSWSSWSQCDVSCGKGTNKRTRKCLGGVIGQPGCENGSSEESKECQREPCRSEWTNWQEWSDCTQSCASGVQYRRRSCSEGQPGQGGCVPATAFEEDRSCNEQPCYSCEDLFPDYCNTYFSTLTSCQQFPNEAQAYCLKSCNLCPELFGEWGTWSSCSVSCGFGTKSRERVCNTFCEGLSTDSRDCRGLCRDEFSSWSEWTECSVTCDGGIRSRTRRCSSSSCQPDETGNSDTVQELVCNTQSCVIEGWEPWSEWSGCTVTCGDTGVIERTRKCTGRRCVGDDKEERSCPSSPTCPGTWGEWSRWNACTVSCGGGVHERSRTCINGIIGESGCEGEATETGNCNAKRCPPSWGQWGEWQECRNDCKQSRSRDCVGGNGRNRVCTAGSASETRDCETCPSSDKCENEFDEQPFCPTMNPEFCYQKLYNNYCRKRCCSELRNVVCEDDPTFKDIYCVPAYQSLCTGTDASSVQIQRICLKFCGICQ